MSKVFFPLIFFILLLLTGCKNYYNDMVMWTDEVPKGSSIDSVKKNQPDFVQIDWEKPDTTLNGYITYRVTSIKGNYNFFRLTVSNRLAFTTKGYEGRWAKE